jgi:hypothetical protein
MDAVVFLDFRSVTDESEQLIIFALQYFDNSKKRNRSVVVVAAVAHDFPGEI